MSCPVNFDEFITQFFNIGWENLKKEFKNPRIAKTRTFQPGEIETLSLRMIELLTSARIFLVEYLFQCYNPSKENTYTAFGSTALFSDYDITLLGRDAPEIMIHMFNRFVKQYKNTLTSALDTNLYCSGYFSSKGSRNIPERVLLDGGLMALQPKTNTQTQQSIMFAGIKLVQAGLLENPELMKHPRLMDKLQQSAQTHQQLQSILRRQPISRKYSQETNTTIQRYNLNYAYASKLYTLLYRSKEPKIDLSSDLLFMYACCANYFAIEAYYTPSTINVVVLELQGKKKIHNRPIDYLCAVLENLGDLLVHFQHYRQETKLNPKYVLLSLSKYIQRIYFALGKASNQSRFLRLAQTIEEKILVHKKSVNSDLEKIPFSKIGYTSSESLDKYIYRHMSIILVQVEKLLKYY
jgi:hypothetical protein